MKRIKPLENAVIIDGVIYELTEDHGYDVGLCNHCALNDRCRNIHTCGSDSLCVVLFDDAYGKIFVKSGNI